jgi:hypothetical protein
MAQNQTEMNSWATDAQQEEDYREDRNEDVALPKDIPNTPVWVSNLPFELQPEVVHEFFAELSIVDIKFGKHHHNGKFNGSCMIHFATAEGMNSALMADGLVCAEFGGRKISVKLHRSDNPNKNYKDGNNYHRQHHDGNNYHRQHHDGNNYQRQHHDGNNYQRQHHDGNNYQRQHHDGNNYQRQHQDGNYQKQHQDGNYQKQHPDGNYQRQHQFNKDGNTSHPRSQVSHTPVSTPVTTPSLSREENPFGQNLDKEKMNRQAEERLKLEREREERRRAETERLLAERDNQEKDKGQAQTQAHTGPYKSNLKQEGHYKRQPHNGYQEDNQNIAKQNSFKNPHPRYQNTPHDNKDHQEISHEHAQGQFDSQHRQHSQGQYQGNQPHRQQQRSNTNQRPFKNQHSNQHSNQGHYQGKRPHPDGRNQNEWNQPPQWNEQASVNSSTVNATEGWGEQSSANLDTQSNTQGWHDQGSTQTDSNQDTSDPWGDQGSNPQPTQQTRHLNQNRQYQGNNRQHQNRSNQYQNRSQNQKSFDKNNQHQQKPKHEQVLVDGQDEWQHQGKDSREKKGGTGLGRGQPMSRPYQPAESPKTTLQTPKKGTNEAIYNIYSALK